MKVNPIYAEIVAQFIEDCCEVTTPAFTTVEDMHAAFFQWANARAAAKNWKWWLYCDTRAGMAHGMTALGIKRHRNSAGIRYTGLALRPAIAPTNPAS